MKNTDYDFLIIGAGVVGLAAAELLARNKFRVLIIEKENRIGTGISSRNSEVIHAGIYYPASSLKSLLCLQGKTLLYSWCKKKMIPYYKIGKYIIANGLEELESLEKIKQNALNAGLKEIYSVTSDHIRKEENEIDSSGGLFSPTTGIISVHQLMDSLKRESENNSADFLFLAKLVELTKTYYGYSIKISDSSNECCKIKVEFIINCSGLSADQISEWAGISNLDYKIKFVKGNYFKLAGQTVFVKHLIYPLPKEKLKGLGIHLTIDMNKQVKFGPDTEDLEEKVEDYRVVESKKMMFYEAIKQYFPKLDYTNLIPDYAGIRPQLAIDRDFKDFIIKRESEVGSPNFINCIGIESPGLTSSLAIAEHIYKLIN